jgi:hypothetical protein
VEIIQKLYLELANVVPPDCISAREAKLRERIAAAELALHVWDETGSSEYFVRYPEPMR